MPATPIGSSIESWSRSIFGAEAGTDLASAYGFRAMYPQTAGPLPEGLDAALPSLTEDSFPGVLTNVIAGRIANRLDLGGVNYTVDAACASSLAAVDMACKELRAGTSNMVLCGGADLHNGVNDYLLFAGVHALSPTGQCRSFDADADGIALGEGVACVALKRLEDAERDGDRIYAVIDGIAGSSDGRSLGLTAPRPEGQRRALERAYRQAGMSPADVGLVEAHGTGTVVGDRTELTILDEVFGEAGSEVGSVALGSVKSQIGHTKCTAGMAGLIKTALSLQRGVRPPTVNIVNPNPAYDSALSPFIFNASAQPWATAERAAGISAFGFGGTNFHAVLSAYEGDELPAHGLEQWPAELFCFRSADRAGADDQIARLEALIDSCGDPAAMRLRDLACTVSEWGASRPGTGTSRPGPDATPGTDHASPGTDTPRPGTEVGPLPVKVAVVADDIEDLRAKLDQLKAGEADPRRGVFVAPPQGDAGLQGDAASVAFLYPGQGSQRPGMLADLFVAFPSLQRWLRSGAAWVDRMFPPAAFSDEGRAQQREALTDTRVAQPALGIAGLAMTELLDACGIRPMLPAVTAMASWWRWPWPARCPKGLLALSEERGRAMLGAAGDDPGTMAAVARAAWDVRSVLSALPDGTPRGVVVANDNSPSQVVLSGPTRGMEEAVAALEAVGVACRPIPVACAFHSSVVAGAEPAFADALVPVDVHPPAIDVFANTTAEPYPSDPAEIRALLARQLASPVRFREQIEAMYNSGVRTFVEAGSGRVLTQLVGKILKDRPHTAVACDAPGDNGVRRFLFAVAELASVGVPVDTTRLFEGRARPVDPSTVAKRTGWKVNGHLVRTAAGDIVPGGLLPAPEMAQAAFASNSTGAPTSGGPLAPAEPIAVGHPVWRRPVWSPTSATW